LGHSTLFSTADGDVDLVTLVKCHQVNLALGEH
jgi:hypothetical protein